MLALASSFQLIVGITIELNAETLLKQWQTNNQCIQIIFIMPLVNADKHKH